LSGVEKETYVQVAGFARVLPIANEDLDRPPRASRGRRI
jgi:hypothetical protein